MAHASQPYVEDRLMIDRARLIQLIDSLDHTGITTWTTPLLKKYTYINGQDLYRLQIHGLISPGPRDPKGCRIWSPEEMRELLTKLREIMESHDIVTLHLENDKYLRWYKLISEKKREVAL